MFLYLGRRPLIMMYHSFRLVNLGILAAMATVCAIVDSSLEKKYFPLGAPWLFGDDRSDDNPRINGIITFAFALLTYVCLLIILN